MEELILISSYQRPLRPLRLHEKAEALREIRFAN